MTNHSRGNTVSHINSSTKMIELSKGLVQHSRTASVMDMPTIVIDSTTIAPSTPSTVRLSHPSSVGSPQFVDNTLATSSNSVSPISPASIVLPFSPPLAPLSPIGPSVDDRLLSFQASIDDGTVIDSLQRQGDVASIEQMIALAQCKSDRSSSGTVLLLALLQTHSALLTLWRQPVRAGGSSRDESTPTWEQLTATLNTEDTQRSVILSGQRRHDRVRAAREIDHKSFGCSHVARLIHHCSC